MRNQIKSGEVKRPVRSKDDAAFRSSGKATIGRTTFLLERHFNSSRSLEEAIYEMVKNEAVRNRKPSDYNGKI